MLLVTSLNAWLAILPSGRCSNVMCLLRCSFGGCNSLILTGTACGLKPDSGVRSRFLTMAKQISGLWPLRASRW